MIPKTNSNATAITAKFVAKESGLSIPAATARIRKYKDGELTYRQMLAPRGESGTAIFTEKNKTNKKQPSEINFRGTCYKKTPRGLFYRNCSGEWIKARLDKQTQKEIDNDFRIAAMRGGFA